MDGANPWPAGVALAVLKIDDLVLECVRQQRHGAGWRQAPPCSGRLRVLGHPGALSSPKPTTCPGLNLPLQARGRRAAREKKAAEVEAQPYWGRWLDARGLLDGMTDYREVCGGGCKALGLWSRLMRGDHANFPALPLQRIRLAKTLISQVLADPQEREAAFAEMKVGAGCLGLGARADGWCDIAWCRRMALLAGAHLLCCPAVLSQCRAMRLRKRLPSAGATSRCSSLAECPSLRRGRWACRQLQARLCAGL